jgi:5'-nucleotidase
MKLINSLILVATLALLVACMGDLSPEEEQTVNIIALNDFHGNIDMPDISNGGSVTVSDPANPAGTKVPTGGAAYLATLVKQIKATNPNNIMVGAGDIMGASPFTGMLTHQESTVDVMNAIGLEVTAVGNHEFDQGKTELLRMQNGGCYPSGTIGTDTCLNGGTFSGAKYKYLAANVVDTSTNKTLFDPTYIKKFGNLSVGFIGLTFKDTPTAVLGSGVAGLSFLDEATTINNYAAELKSKGVSAVVVLIHQGGQTLATSVNDKTCPSLSGEILNIVDTLSSDVAVVISGHTHQEYICTRNNKLLTSTGFYGQTLTNIELKLKGTSVVSASANNIPVINDNLDSNKKAFTLPSGMVALSKDSVVDAIITTYNNAVTSIKNMVVGSVSADIKRALLSNTTRDEGAEGAMGDVVADFIMAGVSGADFALTNPGGVRADLIQKAGGVTYSDLIAVAPYNNDLVTVELTGAQIVRLLEQQWEAANCAAKANTPGGANGCGRMLQPSKELSYTWDRSQTAGAASGTGARVNVSSIQVNGQALDLTKTYRIATVSFLGQGGDNFTVFSQFGKNYKNTGVKDIEAFVNYMKAHPGLTPPSKRITRVN